MYKIIFNLSGGCTLEDKMKNMVILKNIPSNIVDEAIVILKPNAKVKSIDVSETNKVKRNNSGNTNKENNQYIINEAELVIANFVSKMENNRKIEVQNMILKKYKLLKYISWALVFSLIITVLFL